MRGVHIFEKPCYREIRVMRGRAMRGLPVPMWIVLKNHKEYKTISICKHIPYLNPRKQIIIGFCKYSQEEERRRK